jgi:hypothetical protein
MAPRKMLFPSKRILHNKDQNPEKLSWIRVLVKMLVVGIILLHDIQRHGSNYGAHGKVSGNKD